MNEGFRYVRDYLYSELEEVENLYKELSNKEKSLELEIREIASRLGLMKGNIDFAYEADTYFPNLDEMPEWTLAEESDEQTYFDLEYVFATYVRK